MSFPSRYRSIGISDEPEPGGTVQWHACDPALELCLLVRSKPRHSLGCFGVQLSLQQNQDLLTILGHNIILVNVYVA